MSIAEFYIDNGIDPGDPDSMDAFLAGAAEGHSDGAWCYAVQKGLQEEEDFSSFPKQQSTTAKTPSSFGREWRAVVQGKFRVHTRGIDGERVLGHGAWDEHNRYVDLFTSKAFKLAVATHREAEKYNPRRTADEKRSTLKFPGLWDKRNFIWYTDEDGVEHRTNDLIQFLPVPSESRCGKRTQQEAEDLFWSAAVLWKHFGSSGNSTFDNRFEAELAACTTAGDLSKEGAKKQFSSPSHAKGYSISAIQKAKTVCIGTVIKWFNNRGFGFVRPDDSSEAIFAHVTQIVGENNALVVGKMVSFTRVFNAKRGKFQATKISGEGCTQSPAPRQLGVNFQRHSFSHGSTHNFHHGMHLPPTGLGSDDHSGNGVHLHGHYGSAHLGEGGARESGADRSYGGYSDTYVAGMNGGDMGAYSHSYNNGWI